MDCKAAVEYLVDGLRTVYQYFQNMQLRPALAEVRPGGLESTLIGAQFQQPFSASTACSCACPPKSKYANEYCCDQ
jgi:hypothetical protein